MKSKGDSYVTVHFTAKHVILCDGGYLRLGSYQSDRTSFSIWRAAQGCGASGDTKREIYQTITAAISKQPEAEAGHHERSSVH